MNEYVNGAAGGLSAASGRRDVLLEEIRALVARMLRARIEEIDPRLPFLEMGADSLALTEIVRVIQMTYGLKLSIRQFFEETTTIEALVQHMDECLPGGSGPCAPSAAVESRAHAEGACGQPGAPALAVATMSSDVSRVSGDDAGADARFATSSSVAGVRPPGEAPASAPQRRAAAPAEGGVAAILGQQLQLVSQLITHQLALLGGRAPSASVDAAAGRSAPPPARDVAGPAPQPLPTSAAARPPSGVFRAARDVSATPAAAPSRRLDDRQQRHLDALVARYTQRTGRSKALAQRHRAHLADSRATVGFRFSTKEMLYPIVGRRSAGSKLWDVDGNEYVDLTMGFGVHLFGNRPGFVDEALHGELASGVDLGPRSQLAGEVAELLCEMTGHERVAFCNSGTEAVMTAIRLARARTGRSRIAVFAGSYHGHSDGTLAERNTAGGTFDSTPIAPGIPAGVASDVLVLEYGSDESLAILRQHGGTIAAVLVEPVQSRRPELQPVEFLRALREVTNATGTALVFDEMITGFRVHPAGAQGLFGVQADLATYGKIIGGGMPIGVVAGRAAYMNGIDGGPWQYADRSYPKEEMTFFGGTFCQHPLAMAAARAVLLHLREQGPALQRDLNEKTAAFARAANALLAARRAPVRVEHFGSLFRFSGSGNMDLLFYHLLERGVYIWEWRCCFLSTAHTEADTAFVLDALRSTLDELDASGFLDDSAPLPVDSPLSGKSSPGSLGRRSPVPSNGKAASATAAAASVAPGAAVAPSQAEVSAAPASAAASRVEPVAPRARIPGFVDRRRGAPRDKQTLPPVGITPARAPLELSLSFFGKYDAEYRRDKYDLLFESCRWADTRGFQAVWLPERHFHAFGGLCPNPSVLAAALARSTKNLRLRAGSVVLPLHNPIRVAEEWAMVDNLSGGRVGVAFASGWHPDDFALAPDNYGKHREITFRDADVVRRLWRGEAVSVRGGAGNAIDVRLFPLPAQPELPTWLTIVNNPETYVKAGELGVGVLTNLMGQTQADLARNIALYRAALEQHGWPAEQGHVTALLHTFVASNAGAAREAARRPFAAYLESSIGLFRNLMKSERLELDFDELTADDRRVLCDRAFERYLDTSILVGSPDGCEKVARSLHALGVDEIAAFVDFGVDDQTVLSNLAHLGELREQCRRNTDTEPPQSHVATSNGGAEGAGTPPVGLAREGRRTPEVGQFAPPPECASRPTVPSGSSPEVASGHGVPSERRYPLLHSQAQMWVLAQISQAASTAYTDMVALELAGPLHADALQRALRRLVQRHEALRSRLSADGREQVIAAEVSCELPLVEAPNDEAVRAWLKAQAREAIDLHTAPALQAHLLRLDAQRHVLVLRAHHALVDGWSLGNLVQELGPLYGAACRGVADELPAAPQVSALVRRQAELFETDRARADEAHWLAKLAGPLPGASLPVDRPRPSRPSFRGARHTLRLDQRCVDTVREVSRRNACTPFMTFLAVYVLWLRQLGAQKELVVGVAVGNRPPELGDDLVGSMSQLLPLRFAESRDVRFGDWLRAVRGTLLEAFEHPDYSFARLVQKLGAGQDPGRAPLTSVVFNYDPPLEVPSFAELSVRALPREIGYARYDLYLNVATIDGQVELECDYDTDLFDAASVGRYLRGYVGLIEQLAQDDGRRLSEYTLVTPDDAQRLLVTCNATARAVPSAALPVHRQIESWATKTPNAIAVAVDMGAARGHRVPEQRLTFAELHRRAGALAAVLRQRGVGPEHRVAILASRSPELLVGIVGILQAGAAFVPLEPAHPSERLAFMVADAGARLVVTTAEHASRAAALEVEPIVLDADGTLGVAAGPADVGEPTESCVSPDHLAYVLYTSGSTGRPKGVMVSHRGLADYVAWCREVYPMDEGDGAPLHGSVAFDATLTSIFAPLCSGRTVFIVPDEREIEGLVLALNAGRRYAFVKLTPSHLSLLDQLGAGESLCASTAALILGGEALTASVLAPWRDRAPSLRILNEYGPTEAVVGCALHEGWDALPLSGALSIGRPAADTQLYVLDEHLRLVPPGVTGELFIGGACVSRGYVGAPALTAERFLPNPFAEVSPGALAGSRIYATGDRARVLEDGTLELLGRVDDQVKIRGFRIELGEIASVLGSHPSVRHSVVVARDQTLVAYVSSDRTETDALAATLRAELLARARAMLPAHMVPAVLMILPAMPLTVSGKVDTSRLPDAVRHDPADQPALLPQTDLEARIASVWCELLGLTRVGIHQNFFDLGGHSHLLVRVHERISEQLDRDIPVLEMFRQPTVASLAAFLTTGAAAPAPAAGAEVDDTRARARRTAFAGLRERAERGRA